MTLTDWLRNGWLQPHSTSPDEIANLLAVADRDLAAAQLPGLVADWRLAIAYNAALQLANAALAAAGYRTTHESHHYRAIQTLTETVGADSKFVATLEKFRKKRHQASYEIAGAVADHEVEEMQELARRLAKMVRASLASRHPELMQD